jgi:spermidine synthase
LEFFIGCSALLIPMIFAISLPIYKYVFAITGENQILITGLRTVICFLSLLLPTTMMGGTLPILTSWLVKRGILFGRSFSLLYGINTLGAVFGVIISGFVTLELLGEYRTILLGVFLNFLVATLAYAIYKKEVQSEEQHSLSIVSQKRLDRRISPYSDKVRRVVLVAFIISGFTSLAYEVIWTRQLILFLRTSIYAFSGMLVVFLAGIALGSILMRDKVDKFVRPIFMFGIMELAIGLLSVINLFLFPAFGDYTLDTMMGILGVLAATIIIVFPLTFLFGMIFPTASVCYAKDASGTGSSVGWLYSANTIGSILGALLAGFWLIPMWGSTNAVILLSLINVGLGLLLLLLEGKSSIRTTIYYLAVIPILFVLILQVKEKDPFMSTIELRIKKLANKGSYEIYFNKEGIEGTVTAFSINNNKALWINGVGMTALVTETKLMTHLPIIHTNKPPKEMLIICFGMGTVLKSATLYDNINITSVELVPETYEIFPYYHKEAREILKMNNVHAIVNDGRNYILLSPKKYDIITVDPAPPVYSAGTVNLYAMEFLKICKERLNPEGVMCLWFPGWRADEIKSVLKTFYKVFPNTKAYLGPNGHGFYFIGSMKQISEDNLRHNAEKAFANPAILKDLCEYNDSCVTPQKLHEMFLWENGQIETITKDGSLITDDSPYTEFFIWRFLLKGKPVPLTMPLAHMAQK